MDTLKRIVAECGSANQGKKVVEQKLMLLIESLKSPIGMKLIEEPYRRLRITASKIENEKADDRTWGEFRAYKDLCDYYADMISNYEQGKKPNGGDEWQNKQ